MPSERCVQEGRHGGALRPAGEKEPGRVERLADRHVHVEIAVGAEAADEGDALLLLGAGHAIVGTRLIGDRPVTDQAALVAVRRAAAAAQAIGLAPHRVQPVILTTTAGKDTVRRHLVNDGDVAASVLVLRPHQLCRVIAQAPARRPGRRRAVLAAAMLPTIPTLVNERAE